MDQELKDLVLRYAPHGFCGRGANLVRKAVEKLARLRLHGLPLACFPLRIWQLACPTPRTRFWTSILFWTAWTPVNAATLDRERALLAQVQERNPGMYLIPFLLGEADLKAFRLESGTGVAGTEPENSTPNFDQAMTALARALHQQGKDDEALSVG